MTFKKLVRWRLWSSFIQNATILLIFNHCKSCGKFGNSSHIETGNFLMQNSEAIKVAVLGGGAVVAKTALSCTNGEKNQRFRRGGGVEQTHVFIF